MSDPIKDGGPAFAAAVGTATDMDIQYGMSLRDWFAGQVLNGVYSDREQYLMLLADRKSAVPELYVASQAYLLADAMIKARGEDQ